MKTLCFEIEAQTEFSTHIKGDTLFALMCCQIADCYGQERLNDLLSDYTKNNPFMIVSDFFPKGYLPRPTIPNDSFGNIPSTNERKKFKQKKWIDVADIKQPINQWSQFLKAIPYQQIVTRMHNAVNPKTGLVDGEAFSPYTLKSVHYACNSSVYMLYDETRITADELQTMLTNLGLFGIGRNATRGTGKFVVKNVTDIHFPQATGQYVMTLAPCIPQTSNVNSQKSYYKLFTRFGKQSYFNEGNTLVHKNPVLTADTGAVFCLNEPISKHYIGCGIKNVAQDAKVVFQGYAPVIPLVWEK